MKLYTIYLRNGTVREILAFTRQQAFACVGAGIIGYIAQVDWD